MKQKLKFIVTLGSFSFCLFFSAWMMAQPTHNPIAAYTNHKRGFTGYALSTLPPDATANNSNEPYDVAVTSNYHFQSGASTFTGGAQSMILCKKDAVTGAPLAM